LKFFSDVSKGEQSLDTIIKDAERSGAVIGPFRRRVSELLYATNKPIIIVDIPYGHQALSNAAEEINERTDDFSTAIEKTKQELKEEAANQLEREAHILTEYRRSEEHTSELQSPCNL